MNDFLRFTDYGSELVFGQSFSDHYVAFAVSPVSIAFSLFYRRFDFCMVYRYLIGFANRFVFWRIHSSLVSENFSFRKIVYIFHQYKKYNRKKGTI